MALSDAARERMLLDKKKDYYYFKAHGICVDCRKEKALPDRTLCRACTEKRKAAQFRKFAYLTPDKREEIARRQSEYQKAWRARKKAEANANDQ